MIAVTVILLMKNETEYSLVRNQKENYRYDQKPRNSKVTRNLFLPVHYFRPGLTGKFRIAYARDARKPPDIIEPTPPETPSTPSNVVTFQKGSKPPPPRMAPRGGRVVE